MENYDLLFKYQTNFVGCADHSCEEDQILDDDHTIDDEGGTTLPDGNGDSDSVTIDGKDPYELTDEDIEEGIKAQDANKNGSSLIDSFAKDTLDKLKQLILWFLDPNKKPEVKPVEPEPDPNTGGGDVNPDDGTDGTGSDDIKPIDQNLTLSRRDAQTVKLTSEEKVLTLTNPFGGKNYQYTISARDGKSVTAKFEFLKNGRLVVTGDNIKIVAGKNQKDDIILMGNNCDVDTNDADDIVRVGFVKDSMGYYTMGTIENAYGLITSNEFGESAVCNAAKNNTIKTGSGNDYVVMNTINSSVDTGNGRDKVIFLEELRSNITNAEEKIEFYEINGVSDGKNGWAQQGAIPDCRLFALINGLCHNNDEEGVPNVTVEKVGNNYKVTFNKYNGVSATIAPDEITKFTSIDGGNGYVFGDLDTVLIDMALDKLISAGNDKRVWINYKNGELTHPTTGKKGYYADSSVATAHYNTISKYLTGSPHVTMIDKDDNPNFQEQFNTLWNAYKEGNISNFQVGINEGRNTKLGIIDAHAYSVRTIETDYVELVNPWDDADCLRIPKEDFFNLNISVVVYGVNYFNTESYWWPNGCDTMELDKVKNPSNGSKKEVALKKIGYEVPIVEEIKEIEENIEQVKALLSLTRPKTVEEV